ncbi:La domain-containing protein [Podospora appendiculata]|uniref:La domain-containing protein n=1 Tax=Podospora appendiculata TaxID=314037 RepID=A0AAE1CCF3_9PEZI|nr:La domain-containing protein [Podospora appendiculata]
MSEAAPQTTTETVVETAPEATKETAQNGGDAEKKAPLLKTTATINREDYKKNRKYDASVLPETDDPTKIRAQVEFYFSDSNLPTDKFMWEVTGGPENKPVPVKTLHAFKRMQHFQPYSAVVTALKDSTYLEVVGEEGEEMVKRKKAYIISTDAQKARLARSVYVKGFGDEDASTQFDIEAFFAPHGPINMVKLRRTAEDIFKGSVFVEFSTTELADAFVALDPAPTWKGHELKIMKKISYLEEKNDLIQKGLLEPSNTKKSSFFEGSVKVIGGGRGGRGRGRGEFRGRGRGGQDNADRPRRDNDSNDWKKRRDGDQKNGFKGGRGGRGGRGRGRGDRGSRGRGGRDGDSRPRREENRGPPAIKATNDKGEVVSNGGESTNKRPREDDVNASSAPAAKKVDVGAAAQ